MIDTSVDERVACRSSVGRPDERVGGGCENEVKHAIVGGRDCPPQIDLSRLPVCRPTLDQMLRLLEQMIGVQSRQSQ